MEIILGQVNIIIVIFQKQKTKAFGSLQSILTLVDFSHKFLNQLSASSRYPTMAK